MKFDFTGKTVLVSGGTRGIGAAISRAFVESGAVVVALYAGNHERAAAFATEFASGCLETVCVDVGDYAAVEALFERFDAEGTQIDILVNNAGIRRDAIVGMLPREDWDAVIATNLGGTYNLSKFAVQRMSRQRWGRIVSVTSPSGKFGFAGQANYAASKAGQVALTKSLSKEVAKRKITVNCVSPGFIDTEFIGELPPEQLKAHKDSVPMKRFGKPEEIASAVLFLADESAAYITGATIEITGGL